MNQLTYLFAGPSLFGISKNLYEYEDIALLEPAKRGDIRELIKNNPPAQLILADGVFHSVLSVGHVELREAVNSGWTVWGVSSMGAIRAAEMYHLGMRGFGSVFNCFKNDEDMSDDEVALLYFPIFPYKSASEPLIHIRYFLAFLEEEKFITTEQRFQILNKIKNMWFGYRTLELLKNDLDNYTDMEEDQIENCMESFSRFRIKNKDLSYLLSELFPGR